MRSSYHNLVNFPPLEQHDGKTFRAEVLRMDESISSFDLTGAYEKEKGLGRYIRTAEFSRKSEKITEDFDSTIPAVLSLISIEKPAFSGESILWNTFQAVFDTSVECTLDTISITDERLRKAWPDTIYRTLVALLHSASWTISFTGGRK